MTVPVASLGSMRSATLWLWSMEGLRIAEPLERDRLGLVVIEISFVLERARLTCANYLHGLRREAFELFDLPGCNRNRTMPCNSLIVRPPTFTVVLNDSTADDDTSNEGIRHPQPGLR